MTTLCARLTVVVTASVALGACASSGAIPRPFPGAATPGAGGTSRAPDAPHVPGAPSLALGYSISSTALSLRGTPYRNGGTGPDGFDCSGLVKYVFEQHGIAIPRDTRRQFEVGSDVDPQTLAPGDLVFFTHDCTRSVSCRHRDWGRPVRACAQQQRCRARRASQLPILVESIYRRTTSAVIA
jgi:hypothetical protein